MECWNQMAQLDREIRTAHELVLASDRSMDKDMCRMQCHKEVEELRKKLEPAEERHRAAQAELVRLTELKEGVQRRMKDLINRIKLAELDMRVLQCATLKIRLRKLQHSAEDEDPPANDGEDLLHHSEAALSALELEKKTLLEVEFELDHRIHQVKEELNFQSHLMASIRADLDSQSRPHEKSAASVDRVKELKAEQRHRIHRLISLNETFARMRFRRKEKQWIDWMTRIDAIGLCNVEPNTSAMSNEEENIPNANLPPPFFSFFDL